MEQNENITTDNQPGAATPLSKAIVLWGLVAFLFALFSITHNTAHAVVAAGFLAKSVAVIVGTLAGWIGALIGNALRNFAQPDSVYTSGGFFHLIWIKIFWLLGPQTIGLVLGALMGCGLVLR